MTEEKEKQVQPRAKMSVETQLIYRHLKNMKPGEVVTYEELKEIGMLSEIPSPNNTTAYQRVYSARKHLEFSDGISFDTIRSADEIRGLVRLTDDEATAKRMRAVYRDGQKAQGERRKLVQIDYANLSQTAKIDWNVAMTLRTMTTKTHSKKGIATLTSSMEQNGPKVVDFTSELKMFESQRAAGKM